MPPATNVPFNYRKLQDATLLVTATLPTANNTTVLNTGNINLATAQPFPVTDKFVVSLQATAAAGANNKNVNAYLQHTPANSDGTANSANWTNIPELANPLLQIVDANGAGSAAKQANVVLPPTVKQFIRAQYNGEANGGNSANGTLTLTLLF